MSPQDKVGIITGGTAGIGNGIAKSLAAQGVTVVITGRNFIRAEQKAAEIVNNGGKAWARAYDLSDLDSGRNLITATVEQFGKVDFLVNNAIDGNTLPPLAIEAQPYDAINAGITVNLTNCLALTAQAYPYLKKSRGCVLNIGSAVVNRYMASIPLYAIIKASITQMTKTLAAEWAADGIRVNQINPGLVKTEAFVGKGIPDEHLRAFFEFNKQFLPLGKVGTPEDIGPLAAFMVSEDASWMTGSIIDIDGGYSIQGVPAPKNKMETPG